MTAWTPYEKKTKRRESSASDVEMSDVSGAVWELRPNNTLS